MPTKAQSRPRKPTKRQLKILVKKNYKKLAEAHQALNATDHVFNELIERRKGIVPGYENWYTKGEKLLQLQKTLRQLRDLYGVIRWQLAK